MRILCIEDETPRIRWIQAQFPEAEIHWVLTPDQVRYAVGECPRWDLICWDVDLGLKQDGLDYAVGQIGYQAIQNADRIWVWSINGTEGPKVLATLTRKKIECDSGVEITYHMFDENLPPDLFEDRWVKGT